MDDVKFSSDKLAALNSSVVEIDEGLQQEAETSITSRIDYFVGKPTKHMVVSLLEDKPIGLSLWQGNNSQIVKIFGDEQKFVDGKTRLLITDKRLTEDDDLSGEFKHFRMYGYVIMDPTMPDLIGALGVWPVRDDAGDNQWLVSAQKVAKELRESNVWAKIVPNTKSKSYELTKYDEPGHPAIKSSGTPLSELVYKCFGDSHIVDSSEHTFVKMLTNPFYTAVQNDG
jgi:hypothetical protein